VARHETYVCLDCHPLREFAVEAHRDDHRERMHRC
jgi:hypothetical protein